jgi:hypothetical protein
VLLQQNFCSANFPSTPSPINAHNSGILPRSASAANHSVLYFPIFLTFTVAISLAQPTPAVRALHYEQCTACTAWSRNLCQLRNHRRACLPAITCYPAQVWMTDLAARRSGSLEGHRRVSHGRLQCFGVQSREANFDIVIRPAYSDVLL